MRVSKKNFFSLLFLSFDISLTFSFYLWCYSYYNCDRVNYVRCDLTGIYFPLTTFMSSLLFNLFKGISVIYVTRLLSVNVLLLFLSSLPSLKSYSYFFLSRSLNWVILLWKYFCDFLFYIIFLFISSISYYYSLISCFFYSTFNFSQSMCLPTLLTPIFWSYIIFWDIFYNAFTHLFFKSFTYIYYILWLSFSSFTLYLVFYNSNFKLSYFFNKYYLIILCSASLSFVFKVV